MFFKSAVNRKCDTIDFVQETKYLGVMLNSQLKTSIDIFRQTQKFYAQANHCATLEIVLPMSNPCCLGHIAQTCTVLLYGSTLHLVV